MKTVAAITIGIIVGSALLPAAASADERQQLAQCKSEMQMIYGQDARFKLRSMQKGRQAKMRIQAMPAQGDSVLVTCWKDNDGAIHLADKDGVALLAPDYDAGDKVSLND